MSFADNALFSLNTAGAVLGGDDFEDAVKTIAKTKNQDEIDVLEGAGIDVDDVLAGGDGLADDA